MNFWNFLYLLLIYPLELLFETVFALSEKAVHNPCLSIVALSLVVNLLALPLYKRADEMQAQERAKEKKMEYWVTRIKKTFKGDERFMMLQYYYSLEDYKPYYVLKISIPLLLQVPFFIAAYNFLSGLNYIEGVSLGPISNLAEPDKLLMGINVLPIAMTIINIVSSSIYAKDMSLKTKVQMYGMALLFLVLLYNSPSGLVFYWTLNNVFSLVKNVVMEYVHVKLPQINVPNDFKANKGDGIIYLFGCLNLAVLIGLTIPGATIASSPLEFMSISGYISPLTLVYRSFAIAIGFTIIWFGVFYMLMSKQARSIFAFVIAAMTYWALWDYFLVDRPKTKISSTFLYQAEYHSTSAECLKNVMVMLLVAVLFAMIWKYKRTVITYLLFIPLVALVFFSGSYLIKINNALDGEYFLASNYNCEATYNLSTDGQNVVVVMMDRAIGGYFGYAIDSYPELMEEFDGFTYYPNTVSYGSHTLFAAPALYGGAEYSASNMELNSERSLADKLNEAMLVMPVMFSENGFSSTVINPTYAGYCWIPNTNIYDPYDVNSYIPADYYCRDSELYNTYADSIAIRQERNLFCYSLTKIFPAFMIDISYDGGNYNALEYGELIDSDDIYYRDYMVAYAQLQNFPAMTTIVEDDSDNYVSIANDTTHEAMLNGDNRYMDGVYHEGETLRLDTAARIAHWQVNFASYEALAEWLDYLRANGVYDNTRIIIVSDHGFGLGQEESMIMDNGLDLQNYNPLLLFKDFNSTGFTIDDSLTTNAIVPYLATSGLTDGINPFTGNRLVPDDVSNGIILVESQFLNPSNNPGNTFHEGIWYRILGDNIYNMDVQSIDSPCI